MPDWERRHAAGILDFSLQPVRPEWMSFHGCIRETFLLPANNGSLWISKIFVFYLYMSLNVNPLSPDEWFCSINEVCAEFVPHLKAGISQRVTSSCTVCRCCILGDAQWKFQFSSAQKLHLGIQNIVLLYSRPWKGGVLEHNILWETACHQSPSWIQTKWKEIMSVLTFRSY